MFGFFEENSKIVFELPNVQQPLYLAWKVQLDELSSVRVGGGGGFEKGRQGTQSIPKGPDRHDQGTFINDVFKLRIF